MEELSIEKKAKAYDEALEKAKDFYKGYKQRDNQLYADDLETIFPELRESKDEKIRQKFIKLVKMSNEVGGFALHKWEADEMLAWLEKQGEQKPAGWSEEDENRINRLIAYFEDEESFTAEDDIVYANWLKSLKDRYTWKPSDEQMIALRQVISGCSYDIEPLLELETKLKEFYLCTDISIKQENLGKIPNYGKLQKITHKKI